MIEYAKQTPLLIYFCFFIRCIVPDKDVYMIVQASLHPTLQAWFRESDIGDFVNNILLHKIWSRTENRECLDKIKISQTIFGGYFFKT